MADNRLKSIVVVGGGTAGWMAAAALIDRFGANRHTRVTLVESPDIGTVGVGEATVPHIREFLKQLKINEVDFVKRTSGTFKLAIGFEGWAGEGSQFFHPFAEHGVPLLGTSFQHYWVKLRSMGWADDIDRYVLSSELAQVRQASRDLRDLVVPIEEQAGRVPGTGAQRLAGRFADRRRERVDSRGNRQRLQVDHDGRFGRRFDERLQRLDVAFRGAPFDMLEIRFPPGHDLLIVALRYDAGS